MSDKQQPGTGKVENDHNQQGNQEPTQRNEGQRTPQSRHDRDAHVGSSNQVQSRQGGGPSTGAAGGLTAPAWSGSGRATIAPCRPVSPSSILKPPA